VARAKQSRKLHITAEYAKPASIEGVQSDAAKKESQEKMIIRRNLGCTSLLAALAMALLAPRALAEPPQREAPRAGGNKPRRGANRPQRHPDKLKTGDAAPTFSLKSLDGKKSFVLAECKGKKPVALIFGSYT
jgi:hypothetical protein